MNENIVAGNYNNEAYRYLLIARNTYQQYLQEKQQLYSIDNQIMMYQSLYTGGMQSNNMNRFQLQNNRFQVEMNLRQHIETIGNNTAMATLNALMALQIGMTIKDQISAMLYDNSLSSICSFIEMTGMYNDIHTAFKRYCNIGSIVRTVTDITTQNVSLSYSLPGIRKLQMLL